MDSFTLKDAFNEYPYRDKDIKELLGKAIDPYVYVKKEDVVADHKYSCTYKDFMIILKAYVEVVLDYLVRGRIVELPYRMGTIHLIKYEPSAPAINWKRSNERNKDKKKGEKWKFTYHDNSHTDGNIVKLKWTKKGKISGSRWFKARIPKRTMRKLLQVFINNPTQIYKIQES